MAATLVLLWAMLIASDGTSIGRVLRFYMVSLPATACNHVSRAKLAIAFVVLLLLALHAGAAGNDPIRLAGLFAPELALWLATFEFGLIGEAAAGLAAGWKMTRMLSGARGLPHVKSMDRSKLWRGSGRSKRGATPLSSANDDEDGRCYAEAG